MRASNINFQTNPSFEQLFLDSIIVLTAEMHKNQEGIPESMFNELGFPIDQDVQGDE